MQTLRDIRRRIKSIDNTRQIARAMEMVSAARLKRAQERLLSGRPYAEGIEAIVKRVCSGSDSMVHPFLLRREKRTIGICVVTSDRGLCGAFNVNVIREAEELARGIAKTAARDEMRAQAGGTISREETVAQARGTTARDETRAQTGKTTQIRFLPVGKKAFRHFRRKEAAFLCSMPELGASADRRLAIGFTNQLIEFYLDGKLDEIWIVFTHFISSGSRRVVVSKLLPLELGEGESAAVREYIYEPRAQELLQALLPKYVATKVFMAFAESSASEHSARMVAMSFATKNADDMVDTLTLLANRARQSSITREIADIVGTAELLR